MPAPPAHGGFRGVPRPSFHRFVSSGDNAQRDVDGRAPAVFLMRQIIDNNSPCSIVDPQNPGSPNRGFRVGTVTLAQSATAAPSAPVVAAICAAEILGLAGFSIVPALLPQFIDA